MQRNTFRVMSSSSSHSRQTGKNMDELFITTSKPAIEAEPKISVIMMLYNGRTHLLKRAVQSVLDQTYKNWELILQDDCSTDGTFEMAVGFALLHKRIKIFRNKINLGIVKNRAAAFRNTTGDLICHVDNDDFIYPHALETMVKEFRDYPDIGLAYSDMAYVDKDGLPTSYLVNRNHGQPLAWYGWRHLGMYRRTAYNQTEGFNEKLAHACEDGDLFVQIAEKFPFRKVPQVLYAFNNDGGSHEGSKRPECKDCPSIGDCNFIRVFASGLSDLKQKVVWQKQIEEAKNNG